LHRANLYAPEGYLFCMSTRSWIVFLGFLVLGTCLILGCMTSPPATESPRYLIEEYVLAYNRGDADTIYGMLVAFDSPQRHPRYATAEELAEIIHEKRVIEGIRIADYRILEDYMIEEYAVITVDVTWEHGGEQLNESRDAGFMYLNGEWKLVDLILPPSF
jgi:hypothetical protein